jgi:endonuclease V-like protein UPF0215 family
MVQSLTRRDLNVILLSGCVIAWFNIIDPGRIRDETGVPVICVTYEESDGLLDEISRHFPGDESRLSAYLRLGDRVPLTLRTGETCWLRSWGLGADDAGQLCNDFTLEGKIPEPLRVARICARHAGHYLESYGNENGSVICPHR